MLRKTTVFLSLLSTFLLGNEVSWGTISPGKERDLAEKQKLSTQASGDWGGLAAFGEVGPKNLRGSATYGVYFNPSDFHMVLVVRLHSRNSYPAIFRSI